MSNQSLKTWWVTWFLEILEKYRDSFYNWCKSCANSENDITLKQLLVTLATEVKRVKFSLVLVAKWDNNTVIYKIASVGYE